jgi:hypothetical protein
MSHGYGSGHSGFRTHRYHGDSSAAATEAREARGVQHRAEQNARHYACAALRPKGIEFRTPFLERLNGHAINLAVEHGISIVRCANRDARTYQEARQIYAPAVTNEQTYSTFLHEVGHLLSPAADSRQYRNHETETCLISPLGEIGAWRWAVTNALQWTLEMHENLSASLTTYASHATPDERIEMMALVQWACVNVTGPTWTFGELGAKCAAILQEGTINAAGLTPAELVAAKLTAKLKGLVGGTR